MAVVAKHQQEQNAKSFSLRVLRPSFIAVRRWFQGYDSKRVEPKGFCMSKYECTEDRFFNDVKNHVIQIIRDDGVHRHIRFKAPNTNNMYFDLITWPGHLCYTGDMGTYVFQRLEDMFQFFRTDREYATSKGQRLSINLGYWTEKLIAIDGNRHGARAKEFDADEFVRVINEYRIGWMRDAKESGSLDKNQRRELWEAVDYEVLRELEGNGERAQIAAHDFYFNRSWHFQDLFEHDFTDYTFRMVWCCYALSWGIQQYDEYHDSKSLVPA